MSRISCPRKLLALLPGLVAFWLSDKTVLSIFQMLVGGLVFWVPYWLAWWLSDGFATVRVGSGPIDDDFGTGYRWGSQGYGYYQGGHRVH